MLFCSGGSYNCARSTCYYAADNSPADASGHFTIGYDLTSDDFGEWDSSKLRAHITKVNIFMLCINDEPDKYRTQFILKSVFRIYLYTFISDQFVLYTFFVFQKSAIL